jgi:hypothetical protein
MANATTTSKTMMLEECASLLQHAAAVAILALNQPGRGHPYKSHTLVTVLTHTDRSFLVSFLVEMQ